MAGVTAFRESYLSTDPLAPEEFESFEARYQRYAVYWAFFEQTAYRNIHNWATKFKADFALYRYTRSLYNPAFRLATFWQSHLWGGLLDVKDGAAGTGGALPIVTSSDALRRAIAHLWQSSNWQARKDIVTLYGPVMGDVGIRVVDDTERGDAWIEFVHPGMISGVTLDKRGFVKAYEITEQRTRPDGADTVTYRETAERDGDSVVYRTYLNDQPYAWNGVAAEWDVAYGFVPFVVIPHMQVGLTYGWSEFHAAMARFREVDDIASKVSDHVRKYVDPIWMISGAQKPQSTPAPASSASTTSRPEPGRDDMPIIWVPTPGADAKPLVAPLDLAAALEHLNGLLELLEGDYPELRAEKLRLSGELTGRAMLLAQQPAEQKVAMRRAGYDSALVRAQQMAVAIGGWRGYAGYEGFNLDSYKAGQLDHAIDERPVFAVTTADKLDEEKQFWETAKVAREAGLDPVLFLREHGWDDDKIGKFTESETYQSLSFSSYPAAPTTDDTPADNGDTATA